ncbi:hypothetical protein NTE_03253 [Candidatus Nitrososphaera evergladensis SR1]|jgi:hypothetical protein|uniref:Phasin protein n=1 Tax=Candidatus Nitrososphaera evergladensis SR1 TaxID=1459636 RepID=A0A075MXE0_9ARCH|nr:hypothetical protein [Candidatus Nitrososphaera evergladensis]AIF85282.1 hypothetical protein NTE_03253 [Candidatus Nitrososphaera evergladensis SR1]
MASRKDDKEESEKRAAEGGGGSRAGSNPNPQQQELQQQQEAVARSIDETKQNIREAIEEARKEIPKYNQVVNDYQNQTIDATRDIAESYLDSQRHAINTMQSGWMQYMQQQQQQSWWGMPMSPQAMADMYTRMAGSFADATIATTRMANNMMFANIEAARATMNHARDNTREMVRIATDFTETFGQASREARSRTEDERRRRS